MIQSLPTAVIWLVAAMVFLAAELAAPGLFFFLSFSAGCIIAALISFLGYSVELQCIAGLLSAAATLFVMWKFVRTRKFSPTETDTSATNTQALIGRKALVTKPITEHEPGEVKIGGEYWPARAQTTIPANTYVRVIRIEGNTAIVSK